jgi:hypothetical protein
VQVAEGSQGRKHKEVLKDLGEYLKLASVAFFVYAVDAVSESSDQFSGTKAARTGSADGGVSGFRKSYTRLVGK